MYLQKYIYNFRNICIYKSTYTILESIYLSGTFQEYSLISAHLMKDNLSNAGFTTSSKSKKHNLRFHFGVFIFYFRVVLLRQR